MPPSKNQVKAHLSQALRERDTRVGCLLFESVRTALDLLHEQSSAVLEALIEYSKDVDRTGYGVLKGPRHDVRLALIRYVEAVLILLASQLGSGPWYVDRKSKTQSAS